MHGEPHGASGAHMAERGEPGWLQGQALFPQALAITQTSTLREITDTWNESSGSFLPISERRRGPKGEPGERGPPGKEVCVSTGWRGRPGDGIIAQLATHSLFCSPRAPPASLENAA